MKNFSASPPAGNLMKGAEKRKKLRRALNGQLAAAMKLAVTKTLWYVCFYALVEIKTWVCLFLSPSSRVHKNKSMQRLISSLWGTGTAKFQVTWLLHIVQKGVSMWQCCAVDRWLMSAAYRCTTKIRLSHFSCLFSSRKLAERVRKGKKVRLI